MYFFEWCVYYQLRLICYIQNIKSNLQKRFMNINSQKLDGKEKIMLVKINDHLNVEELKLNLNLNTSQENIGVGGIMQI